MLLHLSWKRAGLRLPPEELKKPVPHPQPHTHNLSLMMWYFYFKHHNGPGHNKISLVCFHSY